MANLHVLLHHCGRRRHDTRVFLRMLSTFGDFGVEIKNFNDCLRMLGVVVFGNGRGCEKFGPLLGQPDEVAIDRIEAYVDFMGKVGWITDTSHARAPIVDGVHPIVKFVIALELTVKNLLR